MAKGDYLKSCWTFWIESSISFWKFKPTIVYCVPLVAAILNNKFHLITSKISQKNLMIFL